MNHPTTQPPTLRQLLAQDNVATRFQKLLGDRAEAFTSAILQLSQDGALIAKCEPMSILNAAVTAATLNLSLSKSLGEAWIVPYNDRHSRTTLAQFQLGYKGFISLGHRSGKYTRMKATPIDAAHFKHFDPVEERLHADFSIEPSNETAGFYGEIQLTNGFKKCVWWPKEKLVEHAKSYSAQYRKSGSGLWKTHFNQMATKTVIKLLIDRWGPKSTQMAIAISADQSVQLREGEYKYVDNQSERQSIDVEAIDADNEKQRVLEFIEKAEFSEALLQVEGHKVGDDDIAAAYDARMEFLLTRGSETRPDNE
jgi:recombination protein RecT